MKNTGCGQVNIPQVDNSKSECETLVPSECVIVTRESELLNNLKDGTLDDYLLKVDELIASLMYRISVLETNSPSSAIVSD